jgi:hypothetical protein
MLQQVPIFWDKLHELLVALVNRMLGLVLNLHGQTFGTLPEFVFMTIKILQTTWDPH